MADEWIAVVQYDSEWPRRFEAERALLERVLAPWLEGGIHHVGSTAIPGLASKPIIDMVAGVRDLEEARAAFDPLQEQSYLYAPHRPGIAHHFAKPSLRLVELTHSLHLTEPVDRIHAYRERGAQAGGSAPVRRTWNVQARSPRSMQVASSISAVSP